MNATGIKTAPTKLTFSAGEFGPRKDLQEAVHGKGPLTLKVTPLVFIQTPFWGIFFKN